MKEKAPSETAMEAVPKLSLSPTAQSPGVRATHINLLANSLASKLKQQKTELRNAQKLLSKGGSCAEKRRSVSHATKSILSRPRKKGTEIAGQNGAPTAQYNNNISAVEAKPPPRGSNNVTQRRARIDSAASDQVLGMTSGEKKTSLSSRRTSSAGSSGRRSMVSMSEVPTKSEMSFLGSRGSGASGSALSFDSRGGGRSVQVIKRDGVFQPLDKYAPGRNNLREASFITRGACDFELYILPLCEDSALQLGNNTSPRGYDDNGKRSLKVSWSKTPQDNNDIDYDEETKQRESTTPFTPQPFRRVASEDTFAFRRPVHTSGRSRVSGLGVMWEMPSEESPAKPLPNEEPEKKPMWSWLVMHEGRQKYNAKKRGSGHHSRSFSTPTSLRAAKSSLDVRTQHSRDVHPVSTALDREGTSVTKTKWQVPSSSSSTLEAERSVMGRLGLVKRPGAQLLYETSTQGFTNSFVPGVGSSNLPLRLKGSTERIKENIEEMERHAEEREDAYKSGKSYNTDGETVYSDSRQGDQPSSPTKSRSTYN